MLFLCGDVDLLKGNVDWISFLIWAFWDETKSCVNERIELNSWKSSFYCPFFESVNKRQNLFVRFQCEHAQEISWTISMRAMHARTRFERAENLSWDRTKKRKRFFIEEKSPTTKNFSFKRIFSIRSTRISSLNNQIDLNVFFKRKVYPQGKRGKRKTNSTIVNTWNQWVSKMIFIISPRIYSLFHRQQNDDARHVFSDVLLCSKLVFNIETNDFKQNELCSSRLCLVFACIRRRSEIDHFL